MPLGSHPLGSGPLGFAPVAAPSPGGSQTPKAPLLHPGTHDAVPVGDGLLLGVHPTDQAVAFALGIQRSSIASAPEQGHTLGDLEHAARDLEAQVRQRIEQALSRLIDRGEIRLLGVDTTRLPGGFAVDVTYQNLRLFPAAQRSLRLLQGG